MKDVTPFKPDPIVSIASFIILASIIPVIFQFNTLSSSIFFCTFSFINIGLIAYCLWYLPLKLHQQLLLISSVLYSFSHILRCFALFNWLSNPFYAMLCIQMIGLFCTCYFVFIEERSIKKCSQNMNSSTNALMIFVAILVCFLLGFSEDIINLFVNHSWKKTIYFIPFIFCCWLLILVLFVALYSTKNIKINLFHLGMALPFTLFCTLFPLSLITTDQTVATQLEVIARATLFSSTGFMFLYLRYRITIKTPNYHLGDRTLKGLLLLGVTGLIITIPLGYMLGSLRHIYVPFNIIAACTITCLLTLGLRLLLLLHATVKQSKKFWHESRHDFETNLPNRKYLLEICNASQTPISLVAVIDISDFKAINDLYGHYIGDKLLEQFGSTLQRIMQQFLPEKTEKTIVARLGSDEFAVVSITSYTIAEKDFVDHIQKNLPEWWQVDFNRIYMTYCFGISFRQETDFEMRLHEANYAMYEANLVKRKFVPQSQLNLALLGNRQQTREYIQYALENDKITLETQPIFNLKNNKVWGIEVFARLVINNTIYFPHEFMKVIDSDGLHQKLTIAIIQKIALLKLHTLELPICINVATQILTIENAANWLYQQCKALKIPTHLVVLELVEDEMIDEEHFKSTLKTLSVLGFKIALDNFGTGYLSLSRFSALDVDYIKIDKSLVSIAADGDTAPIESAITLAQKHHCIIIAKGIETFNSLEVMRTLGVDCIQGYLTGHPISAEDTTTHLSSISDLYATINSATYPSCRLDIYD